MKIKKNSIWLVVLLASIVCGIFSYIVNYSLLPFFGVYSIIISSVMALAGYWIFIIFYFRRSKK